MLGHLRCAVLFLLAGLAVAPAAHAQGLQKPDDDPFYKAPDGLRALAPGTVLRSREVQVTTGGVPVPGVVSRQIMFRSTDTRGRAFAAVTTLMVPTAPYGARGARPLVSYQMAIDSLGTQCNPSYTMRTGTQKETPTLLPLLDAGYAVTTTDYQGPRMAWTAGLVAARSTLDGIRAALNLPGTGLSGAKTPLGMFGYSGGAQATLWAAEQQPRYAPELKFAGIAAGGIPADIEQVARASDGGPLAGVELGGVFALHREYPELDVDRYLNDKGRALKKAISTQCAEDFITAHPFEKLSDYTTVPDVIKLPASQRVLDADRLGRATPQAPLYLFHSPADQLVPIKGPDGLATKYCKEGASVQYRREPLGEHISYAFTGSLPAYAFLAARFAGQSASNNCGTFPTGELPAAGPDFPEDGDPPPVCSATGRVRIKVSKIRGQSARRVDLYSGSRRIATRVARRGKAVLIIKADITAGKRTLTMVVRTRDHRRTVTVRRVVRSRGC